MDAGLDAVWPLFALRLRSERLVLRLPTDADLIALLAVAKAGIHPRGEMPFGVAWTTLQSPGFERGFMLHHWAKRGMWTADDWWLNLIVELDGAPIGSQTIHATAFAGTRTVGTGSWLGRAFQGRGYGKEMRAAVLGFAFEGLRARAAETEAFLDNAPSNAVSRSLGYVEDGRGSLAPEGVVRPTQKFLMTVAAWRSRPRPPVEIEGLDRIRELFGA